MMRASKSADAQATIFPADKRNGKVCAAVSMSSRAALIILFLTSALPAWAGANFDLVSAAGGITLTQVGNNYISSFGTMNALGIGTPAAGVTVIKLTNGALYLTTYSLFVHGGLAANDTGFVTAYASTNFGNPVALVLQSCPSSSSCTASVQFSNLSTNAGAQTTVIARRSEEHTSELQSRQYLVCRLLLEKKKKKLKNKSCRDYNPPCNLPPIC